MFQPNLESRPSTFRNAMSGFGSGATSTRNETLGNRLGNRFENSATQSTTSTFGNRFENSATQSTTSTFGNRFENSATQSTTSTFGNRFGDSATHSTTSTLGNRFGNGTTSTLGNRFEKGTTSTLGNRFGNGTTSTLSIFDRESETKTAACSQEQIMAWFKEQLIITSQRQDWSNVLMLANTILNWGIGVPQEIYKAAEDAKVAAHSRGFDSPLMFTNIRDLIVCKNNQTSILNQAFATGLPPQLQQFAIPAQNMVQNQVCKQDQIIKGIEDHMLNLVQKQDWEALLLLSNSIIIWSPDVSRDLYDAAKLAVLSCNQRGFTTESIYANLQQVGENESVVDLRKRLDSQKKMEKIHMNEELTQYNINAKTMGKHLTDPDLKKEFQDHFFLKGESREALKRAQGSAFGISKMAIGIQERNSQRVEEDLLISIEKDPSNAHEQLGMSRKLYDSLVATSGSTALFINKYVRSRPIMFFVGILLLKFILVYLCSALGSTISSVASAFGTHYVVSAFTMALPIVLMGALLTSLTFGMRAAKDQLISSYGVGAALGAMTFPLGFLKWYYRWMIGAGIVYEIALLVKSSVVFIYNNGLTTEGASACATSYTDFSRDIVFPGIRTMFTFMINGICEAVTRMGTGGIANSMNLCGVFRSILDHLPGLLSPDISFTQMSNSTINLPISPEVQIGIVNNIFSIFSSDYWKKFNFQGWDDFASFWTSTLKWPGFDALLKFRHNLFLQNSTMNPEDAASLMMNYLSSGSVASGVVLR